MNSQERVDAVMEKLNDTSDADLNVTVKETYHIDASNDGEEVEITSGLVEGLSDDELAFVLAHEIAHVEEGDVGEKRERNEQREAVQDKIRQSEELGFVGKVVASVAAHVASDLADNRVSREWEGGADSRAVELMKEADFDPEGAETALGKHGTPNSGGITDTHPSTRSRIDDLRRKRDLEERKERSR